MEREDDVQLIHAVLAGDATAFSRLVEKYQKSVHALAWRKIGDFHYAEEITQDTFLHAYQKLSTLRDPSKFLRWLYVITNRICLNWLRKQKPVEQLLTDTPMKEIVESSYQRYVLAQREAAATEHRFDIVNKLLEKLPAGERTVMTLHYLGEMTTSEISKFLGISGAAVRTRLHRARERLQKEEARLIQAVLGGVQISLDVKQNIMREVVDLKPTPSPKPWVAFGTALGVAVLLLLSVNNEYLAQFQHLYTVYFGRTDETTKDERGFAADFTITLGTIRSGVHLLNTLFEKKCRVSRWSTEALRNPDFPVVAAEIPVDIVVVSMRELGFAAGEVAPLDTIYDRAEQLGLETCPVETGPQLRLQFRDQPDWATRERLSEFFVASEPFVLTADGLPKIFSVGRDDRFPNPEAGIDLWLISNDTVDAEDKEHPDRLFNASDPDGTDYGGRFAFILRK